MKKELMIEILKEDRCSKEEAEKFINAGTMIFEEGSEEEFLNLLNEFDEEEKHTIDDVENGKVTDTRFVIYENKRYYIVYVH